MANEQMFRNLHADEIEVRIGSINKGGVNLLLYKNARADQNILDETVGPYNWTRTHSRDNANCIVSIYDKEKNQWISKEDTGVESNTEKEKGLASDSFKRACVNWGIGRELYTSPDIFVFKDKLLNFSYDEQSKKGRCYDKFTVLDIKYGDNKTIASVTIGVLANDGSIHYQNTYKKQIYTQVQRTTSAPAASASANTTPVSTAPANANAITDDEVILLGNCRGKKYGEVKDTAVFKSFLNWVAKSETSYTDEKIAAQFRKFKALATA